MNSVSSSPELPKALLQQTRASAVRMLWARALEKLSHLVEEQP
jgi:hypothetical protein